jgi:hypothetical protein
MSTWRPPLGGAGQFAVTLLPPTRASNSITARRPPGLGSTAALRPGPPGPLHPATCPPIWTGRARASPAADHAHAWGRALGPCPAAQPYHRTWHPRQEDPGRLHRPDATTPNPTGRGRTRPRRVCPAWVREPCEHGCAETQWQTPRRRRRPDGPCLRRNPNLRRGRLPGPALQVQPRSALRDPPRVGPAGGDSATATPPLSCRGPMSAQLGTAPACPHPQARPRRG